MKYLFKKYPLTLFMLATLALVSILFQIHAINPLQALALLFIAQLAIIAKAKRSAALLFGPLTPEQIREFEGIVRDMGGNWADVKGLLPRCKDLEKRFDEISGELKKYKRLQAAGGLGGSGVTWNGELGNVSPEAAECLVAHLVVDAHKNERLERWIGDSHARRRILEKSQGIMGVSQRAGGAITPTDIPLPTIYVPQIVELVFRYGQARQFATVFPLGAGTVKLPRLQAGEDQFSFLGVGTAAQSQAIPEKEVAAQLVTFTANKLGGLIRIPTEIEEDTFVPLGQFLARYISRQFAKMEDSTLFLGDGTGTYANITGVGPYCVANNAYLNVLDAGKTKPSDAQLQDFRNLRSKVNAAVIANMNANGQTQAAYYMHPTMEALLVTFNTIGSPLIYRPQNGNQPATLDGFPIRWIGVSQPYGTVAAPSSFLSFFGDLTYWYLGERGAPRVEVSKEVYFSTDELAMRALERIDVEAMALDAMATLQTAAQ